MDDSFKYLYETRGWHEGLARATAESKGICKYCDDDLLESRVGYTSITLDHLLPQKLYPDFVEHPKNHVLCCASCNLMKRDWDPIRVGENPGQMLKENQDELITRVRKKLNEAIDRRKTEWLEVKAHVAS